MGLGFLTGGAAVAGLVSKVGGYVHDGEVFVDRRLGNYDSPTFHLYSTSPPYVYTYTADGENFRYGIKRRGLAIHKPGVQKWVPLSTRFNPAVRLEPQTVQSQEGRWLDIGGSITYRVIDKDEAIYRAIKAVNNNRATKIIEQLNPLVVAATGVQVASVMRGKSIEEMTDLDSRREEIREKCEEPLYKFGVSLGELLLDNPHPTGADMEANAKIEAAKITAKAIGELASAIRESSQPQQAESDPQRRREVAHLQDASRAASGGVLAHQAAQITQEQLAGPFQVYPGFRDAAEGQF